jgi:protein TonB
VILPDGTVGDLRVERSSGYGLLDTAALAAVKDWRYRPALKDNTPVACRIKINIQFILEE